MANIKYINQNIYIIAVFRVCFLCMFSACIACACIPSPIKPAPNLKHFHAIVIPWSHYSTINKQLELTQGELATM